MATKVGEFFINLAVDAASGNLSVNQLVGALGELEVTSVTTVAGLSKVASAMWNAAKAATGMAVEMSILQDITGADPVMAQKWEKAAVRIGITSGNIVRSIQGVNDMMGGIQAHKNSVPGEFGQLGISPATGKFDAQNRPIMKNFFDMMKEVSDPKSKYWSYTDQTKQQILGGAFPGGDPKDLFRILNDMKAGKWKPDTIDGLDKGQIKSLTNVSRKETLVGQQISDIFQKFLIGGDGFVKVLDSISAKLDWIDKWLASKQGQSTLGVIGGSAKDLIDADFNPYKLGKHYGTELGKQLFGNGHPVKVPHIQAAPQMTDFGGKLDINILGAGGTPLARKEIFLKRGVKNTDVEHVTINAGNGGQGQ